jgi:hypothetical protein
MLPGPGEIDDTIITFKESDAEGVGGWFIQVTTGSTRKLLPVIGTALLGPSVDQARQQARVVIDLLIELCRNSGASGGLTELTFTYRDCSSVEDGLSDDDPSDWKVVFAFYYPDDGGSMDD